MRPTAQEHIPRDGSLRDRDAVAQTMEGLLQGRTENQRADRSQPERPLSRGEECRATINKGELGDVSQGSSGKDMLLRVPSTERAQWLISGGNTSLQDLLGCVQEGRIGVVPEDLVIKQARKIKLRNLHLEVLVSPRNRNRVTERGSGVGAGSDTSTSHRSRVASQLAWSSTKAWCTRG